MAKVSVATLAKQGSGSEERGEGVEGMQRFGELSRRAQCMSGQVKGG